MSKLFLPFADFKPETIAFGMGSDRTGKTTVTMMNGEEGAGREVALVTCPAITMWPRCGGDGNFGTMWGPTDASKAKFTLDLSDTAINEQPNVEYEAFRAMMERIDDRLLDYVTENQLKILGRKNLSREEVKMLQIRSVRPKFDRATGALTGHSIQVSIAKYAWAGAGGKHTRKITVCDHEGKALPNGIVAPGDVVAATIFANMVYTGVGGDKFGIHWGFQDVAVVCQRAHLEQKENVTAFQNVQWDYAKPYVDVSDMVVDGNACTEQFGSE